MRDWVLCLETKKNDYFNCLIGKLKRWRQDVFGQLGDSRYAICFKIVKLGRGGLIRR